MRVQENRKNNFAYSVLATSRAAYANHGKVFYMYVDFILLSAFWKNFKGAEPGVVQLLR